ncbi:hypothetical protein [Listeria aquatica]|uniref:hypothetical protein n=2 Tax=Listeria aquatica TaxID=1494960 RepID=UPI0031F5D0AA
MWIVIRINVHRKGDEEMVMTQRVSIQGMIKELDENKVSRFQVVYKRYDKDELLDLRSQGYLAFLIEGLCFIYLKAVQDNSEFLVDVLVENSILGLEDSNSSNQMCAKVQKGSSIAFIEEEYFFNYLSIRPSFSEFLINYTNIQEEKLMKRLISLSYSGRRKKIISSLMELSENIGIGMGEWQRLPAGIENKFLLEYSNVDRTFFQKTMKELFRSKIVKFDAEGHIQLNHGQLQDEFRKIE